MTQPSVTRFRSGSRQQPVVNRARAWNNYGRAKWCLARARLHLEIGQQDIADYWIETAREYHSRARGFHRRLIVQGGAL